MASKAPVDLSVDTAAIRSSAVTVNAEGVSAALQSIRDAISSQNHRLMVVLPLKWDNLEQEATFHMLLHLLNFTSGAEVEPPTTRHFARFFPHLSHRPGLTSPTAT